MRFPVKTLTLSASVIAALITYTAGFEGLRNKAYPDPAHGWNVPTIGIGTTTYPDGTKVQKGDVVTDGQARALAASYFQSEDRTFINSVKVPLSPSEYIVYRDFVYNIGHSNWNKSTMRSLLNQGQYTLACKQFSKWVYSNGIDCRKSSKCSGIVKRRMDAQSICLAEAEKYE